MQTSNLVEALKERSSLNNVGITFIEGSQGGAFLSYQELYAVALKTLGGLQTRGVRAGNELVLQIEDNRNFVILFWACILGRIIPIPLTVGRNDEHKRKLFNIWPVLNNPYLAISATALESLAGFARQYGLDIPFTGVRERVIDEAVLLSSPDSGRMADIQDSDIAFVQFSSGSTGSPKGVVLTHRNLVANMRAIGNAAAYTTDDSMLSWMPLTHDMGLIGFHLNPLFSGMDQYLMPAQLFIRRPGLWLEKATEFRVSILSSPNFGYEYLLRHAGILPGVTNWDLSNVRLIYNGAEPVSELVCGEFLRALSPFGLREEVMCPVYGLAEASLAVSIPRMGDPVIALAVDRNKVSPGDRIVFTSSGRGLVSFVNVGRPVEKCLVRIVDGDDEPVAAGIIGHIQIKGDNVTSGYYNNPAETARVMAGDGWFRTGDLGFAREAALYITGRAKDILFLNGQNYYPHDIERIAQEVDGIELNKVVAAGFYNHLRQKEQAILFALHRGDLAAFLPLARALKQHVSDKAGIVVDTILPVNDIPRTTSGKLQRFRLLDRYRQGEFDELEKQMLRLMESVQEEVNAVTEVERKLTAIWIELLGDQTVSITRDFFQAGGNSLKAAELSMLLWKTFQVEVPIATIYEKRTIKELAGEVGVLCRKTYTPLPVAAEARFYRASSGQQRLYYSWEAHRSSLANNLPVAFRLQGQVDRHRLEDCIRKLAGRHEVLRSSFHMQGEPMWAVAHNVAFVLDCRQCGPEEIDELLCLSVQPFDLSESPLFRGRLLRTGPGEHILFLDFHHIISDGVSVYHFINELFALYAGNELPDVSVQYKDYAGWEREYLQSAGLADQGRYWEMQLQGWLPVLEMPLDLPRPAFFVTKGEKLRFEADRATTERLRRLAAENECTLHVLLFTIYTLLLSKYTGQDGLVVGIPVSGRAHPDALTMQGMFVNSLPVRTIIKDEETFLVLLREVKVTMEESLKHRDYPFADMVRMRGEKRDPARNPIFDTMFNYQNMGIPAIQNGAIVLSPYFFDPGFSKFDLSMEVFEMGETMLFGVEYATALFHRATMQGLVKHFEILMRRVLDSPDTRIRDLSVMSSGEYEQYTRRFNETGAAYPREKAIHLLFMEQAGRSPGAIALEYGQETMTYGELNRRTDHLASLLVEKGVGPGSIVAILLHRTPALLVSILGVLKAGGCYLPIEPELPRERIRLLLEGSRCRYVISGGEAGWVCESGFFPQAGIVNIDELDSDPTAAAITGQENFRWAAGPDDLAYVLYTSGTTGSPKGVMIRHGSLVNYCWWAAGKYCRGDRADFPLFTSVSFDLTITSIFVPLISGNRIVIYRDDTVGVLETVLAQNKVDVIKLTPSHLRVLLENKRLSPGTGSRISGIIVGGERMETSLARDIYDAFQGKVCLYNEYGPTEATVGCMIHVFDPQETSPSVPIGIPVANMQIYLLDKFLRPVPAGVQGEIYISGDGLARGYLFNEEMTNERFVENPFRAGTKLYKTGDLAKRLSGGIVEYLGRRDHQVKVNGYRIELAEIEEQLKRFPGIHTAVVLYVTGNGRPGQLYAYYISEAEPGVAALRAHLATHLPYYMVPQHFIRIREIPLTGNGKVDQEALAATVESTEAAERMTVENNREALLIKIWAEVLDIPTPAVTDNFFELGGDSIKAAQLSFRLIAEGITLSVKDILTYQTIREISEHATVMDVEPAYEQGLLEGEWPLTPMGHWFFTRNFSNPGFYNQSVLLNFHRKIDAAIMEKTFRELIRHHDGLRCNYDPENDRFFYQNGHLENVNVVGQVDLVTGNQPELEAVCQRIKAGFDIARSLLIRAAILKTDGRPDMLFVTCHHLVMDGVSWRIFLEDLYSLYTALEEGRVAELPSKTASMKDWVKKLEESSAGADGEQRYWAKADATEFSLFPDAGAVDWTAANMEKIHGVLSREKTGFLLREANVPYKTDVSILLNAALVLALRDWTGLETFVIELENHGRHAEGINVARTIGWFTAMFPIQLECRNDSMDHLIKAVKERIRSVPGHGLGYRMGHLTGKRAGAASMTEIRFNYLGKFDKELSNGLFSYSELSTGREMDVANVMTAKLELDVMIRGEELHLEITYNRTCCSAALIDRFSNAFFRHLDGVLEHTRKESDLHFTPSDFDAVELDQEELDALFVKQGDQ